METAIINITERETPTFGTCRYLSRWEKNIKYKVTFNRKWYFISSMLLPLLVYMLAFFHQHLDLKALPVCWVKPHLYLETWSFSSWLRSSFTLSTVPVSLVHPPDQPTHRHIQSTHHTRRCHSHRPHTQITHRMRRLRPHQQPHLHQDSDKNMYRMVSCITDIAYQSYDCNSWRKNASGWLSS